MERRSTRVLLFLALLGSFVLNLFLYREMRNWYTIFNRVRLDPLGFDDVSQREDPVTEKRPLVVFFGDSRAYAWPAPTGLEQFTFANRGVNGHTTTQCLLRFDAHVTPLEPDILVVQVGINDLVAIPTLPGAKEEIVAGASANIRQIVKRAEALGTTVVLSTIFPTGPVPLYQRPFWSAEVDAAIAEVNAYLRSLAGESVVILETEPVLANEKGRVRAEYAEDTLHLNERGYAALNIRLADILADYPH